LTRSSVVVLTNERDFAADSVIRELHGLGVDVRRLNMEQARTQQVPEWNPSTDWHAEPAVVWWRQFETDDRPGDPFAIDDVLVERAQWRTWVASLHTPQSAWMNEPWAARRAENKIEQLRTAAQVGLAVPRTVVTNDAVVASNFRRDVGRAVVKTLSSGYFSFSDQSFVFTEQLSDEVLEEHEAWRGAPMIVQEDLSSARDARVIVIGEKTFGATCRAKGVDWRKTPFDPALWHRWQVPEPVADGCRAYRVVLGLEYVAFDFMLTSDHVYFLEANQAGEWMFLERALDLPIAAAIARRLAEMGESIG
jgi:glutathione synthase/RimK-type ligase-like ATP-grasp enzyme